MFLIFSPIRIPLTALSPATLCSTEFCTSRGTKWTCKIYSEICCVQNTRTCICKLIFAYSKCLLLPANVVYFGMLWLYMQIPLFQHQLPTRHNRYVPFPKTMHFRPYITLLSCKSINTAMSPERNVFAHSFLQTLSILCCSRFPFLNLQLPLLLPRPCFCSLHSEKEQQLYLFCCPVSHLSDTEAPTAPFAKETAFP